MNFCTLKSNHLDNERCIYVYIFLSCQSIFLVQNVSYIVMPAVESGHGDVGVQQADIHRRRGASRGHGCGGFAGNDCQQRNHASIDDQAGRRLILSGSLLSWAAIARRRRRAGGNLVIMLPRNSINFSYMKYNDGQWCGDFCVDEGKWKNQATSATAMSASNITKCISKCFTGALCRMPGNGVGHPSSAIILKSPAAGASFCPARRHLAAAVARGGSTP